MKRCSWCNRVIWPWQVKSEGDTMHARCSQYVNRITAETDAQYDTPAQQETYEMFLARLEDEDGGW